MRGGDKDELRPFPVALANLNMLADCQSQRRPRGHLVRSFRHDRVYDTIIADERLRRHPHFDGRQPQSR